MHLGRARPLQPHLRRRFPALISPASAGSATARSSPAASRKISSGQTSGRISAAPLPLSRMPRTIRRKCVSGSTSPIHCAHCGMPRNGNMKPESRIEGRKKKNAICIACSWFRAAVEKVKPTARLAAMNRISAAAEQHEIAVDRHAEQKARRQQDHARLDVADQDVGQDLAAHHLERPHRHRQQVLHRAALALARDRERGHHHHGHRQHDAEQPRHDVVARSVPRGCSVAARAARTAAAPAARSASGPSRSCVERGPVDRAERRERRAGRRPDRSRRPRAAPPAARRASRRGRNRSGMCSTNCTSPVSISQSASASLAVTRTIRK